MLIASSLERQLAATWTAARAAETTPRSRRTAGRRSLVRLVRGAR
jgi:hypothetical protein